MDIRRTIGSTKAEAFGDSMKKGPVLDAWFIHDKRHTEATNDSAIPALERTPTPFAIAFGTGWIGRHQIDRLDCDDAVPLNTIGRPASCALAENGRGANCGCSAVACQRSGDVVGRSCVEAAAKAVANGGKHGGCCRVGRLGTRLFKKQFVRTSR